MPYFIVKDDELPLKSEPFIMRRDGFSNMVEAVENKRFTMQYNDKLESHFSNNKSREFYDLKRVINRAFPFDEEIEKIIPKEIIFNEIYRYDIKDISFLGNNLFLLSEKAKTIFELHNNMTGNFYEIPAYTDCSRDVLGDFYLLNITKAVNATTNKLGGIRPIDQEGDYYGACYSRYNAVEEKKIAVLECEVSELNFWLDSKLSEGIAFFISDSLRDALVANDITGWESQNYWQVI